MPMDDAAVKRVGFKVDRVEMRGITLNQLEEIEIKFPHCRTIDDVKAAVTGLPITSLSNSKEIGHYSYVERIASGEQRATWCVVFARLQSFKKMIKILQQHAKDRELKPTDTYWIHVSKGRHGVKAFAHCVEVLY